MSKSRRTRSSASFSRVLEDEEGAVVALFVQCCRKSPELREWLWQDFARNAMVRAEVAKTLRRDTATTVRSLADLSGGNPAQREEQRRAKELLPQFVRPYGGRSWAEVEQLVRRYQAGTIDLSAFLLAQAWRSATATRDPSPALVRASVEFMQAVARPDGRRLLRQLDKALQFLEDCTDPKSRRAALGYQDRWKLHALFFMLRHPRDAYRTREIRDHLAETLGTTIDPRDIRRFCTRHGIARDVRAGRPRTRKKPWESD